jgi:hypothetical protein
VTTRTFSGKPTNQDFFAQAVSGSAVPLPTWIRPLFAEPFDDVMLVERANRIAENLPHGLSFR